MAVDAERVTLRNLLVASINPRLGHDLNREAELFSDTYSRTPLDEVYRHMDDKTLYKFYQATGLLPKASLAERLEKRRNDDCFCLNDDDLSERIIMPCCGKRLHTKCIDQCGKCPFRCTGSRPRSGWVGFQSFESYLMWVVWCERINEILILNPGNAIVLLVSSLRGKNSDKLKCDAVSALLNLQTQEDQLVRMLNLGVREALMEIIFVDAEVISKLGRAAENLFFLSSGLFRALCEWQQLEMSAEWFQWINGMLMCDSSQIIKRAFKILRHSGPLVLAPECVEHVVPLLANSDACVFTMACRTLSKLNRKQMAIYMYAVSLMLVAVLCADDSDEVKKAVVVMTLCDLSVHKDNIEAIERAGAIPHLVAMLGASVTDRVKHDVAVVLNLLSRNGKNIEAVTACGAIPHLVAMLRAGGTDDDKQMAAEVLGILSRYNDGNKVAIEESGAISPLVAMLSAGNEKVKGVAARVLGSLSINDKNKELIVQAGAILPLVDMLCVCTDDVKWGAAVALENLSVNDTNKTRIAEANAIPPLVAMLSAGGTDDSMAAAAWALRNLAKNSGNREAILKLEVAMPRLESMLTRGSGVNAAAGAALLVLRG